MLYELILINEIEQRAKIIFLSVSGEVAFPAGQFVPTLSLYRQIQADGRE